MAFEDAGGGYFRIVNQNSGKCLDVASASTADGANIIQYTCGSGTNQQWQWVATGSYFQLKARHSGKCLDVVELRHRRRRRHPAVHLRQRHQPAVEPRTQV